MRDRPDSVNSNAEISSQINILGSQCLSVESSRNVVCELQQTKKPSEF